MTEVNTNTGEIIEREKEIESELEYEREKEKYEYTNTLILSQMEEDLVQMIMNGDIVTREALTRANSIIKQCFSYYEIRELKADREGTWTLKIRIEGEMKAILLARTAATRQDFFDKLNEEFSFTLDPCATKENAKCERFFTKEDDGLSQKWDGRIFCNPPYGRAICRWIKKAHDSFFSRDAELVVLLIPSRTDTKYFHEYLYKKSNVEIRFIKGRLKFGNSKNSAPFPSMLAIFSEMKDP